MSEVVNAHLKKAVQGTALILLGTAMSFVLGFAAKIVIVKNTTQEEFGIYSLSLAIVSVFTLIATLGLHEGITRSVSISLGEGRWEDASSMSGASLRIGLLSGVVFFLGLFLFSGLAARHIFFMPELETPLRVISFFVPFSVLVQVTVGILRGRGFVWPQVYQGVGQSLFFLFSLIVLFILDLPFISIIYAYLFSIIMVFLVVGAFKYKEMGFRPFSLRNESHHHTLLRFSFPLLVVNMTGVVLAWTDTLMLGRYADAAVVGVYNVSTTLARLLEFPIAALAFVFMPIAGELFAKKQLAELKRTYQVLTKWIFSATLPVFFLFFFFPELTITFLFGDRFTASAAPLRILSLGFMSSTFWGANGVLMVALGMSKPLMNVNIFGAVLNVVLNYVLIQVFRYGVMGAAAASMVSIFIMNVLASALIYRESTIHPLAAHYLKPAAGSAVIAFVLFLLAHHLPFSLWLLPLYFFLFIGGCIVSLFVTRSIEREDIALLETVLAKAGIRASFLKNRPHRSDV